MRQSLRSQLSWTFFGLAVIPLLLLAAIISARTLTAQYQQTQTMQEQVVLRMAESVSAYFNELESELTQFAAWSEIASAEPSQRQALLQQLLARQDAFTELVLLDDTGQELAAVSRLQPLPEDPPVSRAADEAFQVPSQHKTTYASTFWLDQETRKPLVTLAVPLVHPGSGAAAGVLLAEARMTYIWDLVADFETARGEDVYIVDSNQQVVAHRNSTLALQGVTYAAPVKKGMHPGLSGSRALLASESIQPGGQVFIIVAEKKLTNAFSLPLELVVMMLIMIVAAAWLAVSVSRMQIRRVVAPLEELALTAQSIAAGNLSRRVDVHGQNELSQLALSFRQLQKNLHHSRAELEEYTQKLELNVASRTKELERRTNQLQTTAELGTAVSTLRSLDDLLQTAAVLISQRFGFYHVGIFLLDAAGEYAVLRASNSPGGQRMLQRGHQLKVGEQGIVGFVTTARSPRIALDVGVDAVFFNNRDLPHTRSEMALPLLVGGKLLGILDVQSEQPNAFTKEDSEILQILASQVAAAIQNSLLYEESQAALERVSQAYGELSGRAWQNLLRAMPDLGYVCSAEDVLTPASKEWTPELWQACQAGKVVAADSNTLAVPISIRGRVNGAIRLRKTMEAGAWNTEEITLIQTLTDQLGVALESARLYQETQRRAEREKMAGEITAHLRASNDPQAILQTAVRELRSALQAQKAQVTLQNRQTGGLKDSQDTDLARNGGGKSNGTGEASETSAAAPAAG
jgi:GAF domain-containing protein/HAMP domain-containing protein